ncbi:LacI family DNA-binding transcriptional regulator [Aestuariibaculum sediminum]|uniref:LacI family DNA-binding transcriptional regulator n=1 Tax=Aestuariibaculum sediminum TaxID=2770637 RepID=A0A8J6Q3E2_9FLAO|nr:LacI family DNA-binding transcriptional regulator [Aestuariibaculum sediminum]MBD0833486.1 LacI family DNA-binding transcriptional regulator [Aestuariibaculum sediminum]
MRTVTLKQIAEELNISVTTVSKALKGYSDVSKETKKRVLDLAERLDYTPNSFAVSLRMRQSKIIGVIIPDTVHYFFSIVIKGILKVAEQHDYMVILMQSNEKFELEKKQIDLLLSKGVDGILISLSNNTKRFDHLQKVIKHDIPLLLFDKIAKTVNCSKVYIDDRKAAYDAVTYLINKGYRRIAHFRGDLNPQNSIDRFLGYKQALLDNNIPFDPKLVYMCNNNTDFDDGYNNAKQMFEDHGHTIDAVFTITDLISIGIIKYCDDNGIKVPDDLALFGFSNWFMSSVINPELSTVEQHPFKIGETSAEILFDEIKRKLNDEPIEYKKVVIPTELVIRKSSEKSENNPIKKVINL